MGKHNLEHLTKRQYKLIFELVIQRSENDNGTNIRFFGLNSLYLNIGLRMM